MPSSTMACFFLFFSKTIYNLKNNCIFASVVWCSGPNIKYSTSYVLNIPTNIASVAMLAILFYAKRGQNECFIHYHVVFVSLF